jgi:hypothetical protein
MSRLNLQIKAQNQEEVLPTYTQSMFDGFNENLLKFKIN